MESKLRQKTVRDSGAGKAADPEKIRRKKGDAIMVFWRNVAPLT